MTTPEEEERFHKILKAAWKRTGGERWDPPRPQGNPFFAWAEERGYLWVCGETAHWTNAGRAAMKGEK